MDGGGNICGGKTIDSGDQRSHVIYIIFLSASGRLSTLSRSSIIHPSPPSRFPDTFSTHFTKRSGNL